MNLTDEKICEVYFEATGQSLREQDKRLAFAFARAILKEARTDGREDWKAVPIEPTSRMKRAGTRAFNADQQWLTAPLSIYHAMLNAAPDPHEMGEEEKRNRPLIIAGNPMEAAHCMRMLRHSQYDYIDTADRLRGRRGESVFLYGSYGERHDWPMLWDLLMANEMHLVRIGD